MAEFAYEALASSGQRSSGTLTAASEREAMAILDARGLFPTCIKPANAAAMGGRRRHRRIRSRYMTVFYSQLADLLHSGVPLLRCLDILERQSSQPVLKETIREVRAKVADGTGLAEAMAQHPHAFNALTISMVRAGQEGGFLEDVLKRVAEFTEHQEDLKAKVVGALAYPVFLAIVGFVIVNILIIFFVPQFGELFKRLEEKNELPWLTTVLIATSQFLASWRGLALLLVIVLSVAAFLRWAKTTPGRMRVDGWRLRLPAVGHLYRNFALSRFTRVLGTLLHNGIPILHALRIAKDSTGNLVLSQAIEHSAENITAGNSLAAPLAACEFMPRDVVEMIAVGEESNSLDTVLVDIANGLDKRTGRQLELFVRLLEPGMLLIMAAVIALVVAGLLLPVFRMGSAVG